jgi:hypothetical protein
MQPYISIVAASRNDDHGGDPLIRTQIFINNLARQCQMHQLPAELIIVDWNPIPERPGLAAALHLPSDSTFIRARTVTVSAFFHQRLKYADRLAFFQMIAKNVGIRRAKGQFILVTNIDILFSDELIQFIARQRLDSKKQYRVDRYDIESGLTQKATLKETLDYAWSHPIRSHRRYQPNQLVRQLYGGEIFQRSCVPGQNLERKIDGVAVLQEEGVWQIRPERSAEIGFLHTNACGDFTLMSRDAWFSIRGYPEFEAFSFNIDSIGIVAAHYAGYEEVALLPPCVCFHIEHAVGSGWTPEGEQHLFERLEKTGILNPEWPVLTPLVEEMRKEARALEFNNPNWGMADIELPERMLGDDTPVSESQLDKLAAVAKTHPVSAIQPAYDLDLLTLLHERRHGALVLGLQVGRAAFYIPDSDGIYSEEHAASEYIRLFQRTSVEFELKEFNYKGHLRFDPCQSPGIVTIYSITMFDKNKKVVWKLDTRNMDKLKIAGTATGIRENWIRKKFRTSNHQLLLVSTGIDPQLILPRLPMDIAFPMVVSVELKVAPSQ